MSAFSESLVRALPDFLDSTVTHRLKQVAQKHSIRHISQSIDASDGKSRRRNVRSDMQTHDSRARRLGELPMLSPTFDSRLPFIESKLGGGGRTSRNRVTQSVVLKPPTPSEDDCETGSSKQQTQYVQTKQGFRASVDSTKNILQKPVKPKLSLRYTQDALKKPAPLLNNPHLFYNQGETN